VQVGSRIVRVVNTVLVIDDDHDLVARLRELLASNGFVLDAVYDYDPGATARADDYLLVVLDGMLPGGSGLDLLKAIRASSNIPVIVLGAMDKTVDLIHALQIGADDYLAKPVDPRELAARIQAILRRTREARTNDGEIKVGDVALSASRRVAVRADKPLELTAVEFNVLECLLRNAGSVVTREALAGSALSRPLGRFDRSVDVHVHNLRKKLSSPADERIKTVRGVGYMYAAPLEHVE
jgi:DNA-binding response OmpR family regulator